jgi:hypothetical protein
MNVRLSWFAKIVCCLIFVLFLSSIFFRLPKAESSTQEKNSFDLSNYDIRLDKKPETLETVSRFIGQSTKSPTVIAFDRKSALEAVENLRRRTENLKIEYNEDLRIPETISPDFAQKPNFLTAPTDEKRADILKNFINQNAELFGLSRAQIGGLEKTADYTNPDGNLSFVHFEQKINSIPVFRGEIKAGFTRKNEILRIINNLAPGLVYESLPTNGRSAEQAVSDAAKYINLQAGEADLKRVESVSNNLKITFGRGQFDNETTAEKIYFPLDYGVARLAWRVLLWQKADAFYVIVDAGDGTLLWRKNITDKQTQTATFNVYGNTTSYLMKTADSPAPATVTCQTPQNCPQPNLVPRQSFTLIGNEPPFTFNQLGWIPDGENRTIGNNAEAGIDRDGTQGIDPNGWAFGGPTRNFVYAYNPAPGNPAPGEEPLPTTQTYPPSAFQQGSITNAFYVVNRWHDEMYRLGFTEQARNYQNNNFGLGGLGNDSILVEAQDSSGTNGANFTTPPDGGRPRLQLYIWTLSTPDRDGALDNQNIIHELTHGVSNRLHGNGTGLGAQGAMMGEGWSDFYALALLSETVDPYFGTYSIGCYTGAEFVNCYYGFRRFPVARKGAVGANGLPHNPLTFGYLNAGCDTLIGTTTTNPNSAFPRNPAIATSGNCSQVHNAGEIWSAALWEMRGQLIDRHDRAEGSRRSLQYTTDGMKLAPLNPTFLQERDAILAATFVSNPSDVCAVWRGFAIRGMGLSASVQTSTSVTEAFDLPAQCRRPKRADFDGDGKSDISVFRPSEGNWYLNRSTAGFTAINWGLSTDTLAPADYDGDGKTDIAVFRPTNADAPDFYILNSANFTYSAYWWGLSGDVPVVEDYDGDNKDDVAIYRSSDKFFYVLKSGGGVINYSGHNLSGTPTAAGDFDGDGLGDFTTYDGSRFYIALSSFDYNFRFYDLGTPGDKPVSADYDGDGIDDAAVFRPTTGTWMIRNSSGGSRTVQFGISTDTPVPADYDGDGRADIAIYRSGVWWINRSTAGMQTTQFGLADDVPVAKSHLP